MGSDRYGRDVLADAVATPSRVAKVDAEPGLVLECASTGWCGAVVGWQKGADGWAVLLEMVLFLGLLVVGLRYVRKKGALSWG